MARYHSPLLGSVILFMMCSQYAFATTPESCEKITREFPGETSEATAGLIANIRRAEGSIAFEMRRLLRKSTENLSSHTIPDFCPQGCKPSDTRYVVFRSIPRKFLDAYRGADECSRMLQQTTENPFRWEGKEFTSVDAFQEWFSDFSRGKGTEGKELYQRCSGLCSPQYMATLEILDGGGIRADVEVICGPARDKSDNTYRLFYGYLATCKEEKKGAPHEGTDFNGRQ
jgi:hypothetical protein